jgi:hypothetical protein
LKKYQRKSKPMDKTDVRIFQGLLFAIAVLLAVQVFWLSDIADELDSIARWGISADVNVSGSIDNYPQ